MPDNVATCVFCKIANGEFGTEFEIESDNVVAFNDIHPVAPVHVLVVPKVHIESVKDMDTTLDGLWQEMLEVAQYVAKQAGIAETGYRLVTNAGPDSGQEVPHLHVHLLGGGKLGGIA